MPTPTLAITLGDPAGIGPEVVAKALAQPGVCALARCVVIGSAPVLQRALNLAGAPLHAHRVHAVSDAVDSGTIPVLEPPGATGISRAPVGAATAVAGKASVEWVLAAAHLALNREIDAIVTAPINKAATHLAGYTDLGHMELFQALTKAPNVATMLLTGSMRVVHLTTHRSLREACAYVTKDHVLAKLRLTDAFFRAHGFARPHIGVAALNPHGGEDGLLGREEIDELAPAVAAAREDGMDADGPVPADSLFMRAARGGYDAVLALYHDQGHIAVKVHGWEESVTMNLGLPFLRTSVDHGTAYDIAGKGTADATGMVAAIRLAAHVASTGTLPRA